MNDEAAAPNRHRISFGHRAVFTVFGLTLAFAFAGGLLIYFKYVAYGRVAARHLPDDTRLAARIDVETLLISDPIRTRLLPLFDQGAPRADLKPRHDRFRAHTGVELGRDLREIVLSVSDAGWVLVFGGKFPRSGLVQGLETTLREEPTPCEFRDGVLQVQNGPAIGQATDGALVVASDAARLRLALRGGEAYLRLGLPPEGAGGFGLRVAPEPPPGLAEFDHVFGSIQLGERVEVDVAVHLLPGASSEPTRIAAAFATLAGAAPAESGARRALETAKIVPHREGEVGVQLSWTRAELNQGVEWLASLLTTQFAQPPNQP
ncbi:MAG TPA: hypothetical protein VHM25_06050 [Polyangiaceae bacterium]|nr:hypothetical protein [Polyangiaceae bacterium]